MIPRINNDSHHQEQVPRKQGLKPGRFRRNRTAAGASRASSTKTRIETRAEDASESVHSASRASSTKTRIETPNPPKGRDLRGLHQEQVPRKQGLKRP